MILTKENYHSAEANREYMSVSQYKGYLECEARQQAIVSGVFAPETTPAMLAGSMLHAWSEGEHALAGFKVDHPEIYTKGGKLAAKFEHIEKMIECISSDEFCMFVLNGQKEAIFTADLFGCKWKIMMDVYAPESGRYVEIKTTKSICELSWNDEYKCKVSFIENYKYMIQAAVYLEIEKIVSGREHWLEPIMLAVSNEPTPDKAIISLKDDDRINYELEQIKSNLPRILAVKNGSEQPIRCERCDYCRSTKKIDKIIHYSELGGY